jgi:hypothetical protein
MELKLDQDVQSVIEYMQRNIPANKLMGVAEKLPDVARLLWSDYSQEPVRVMQIGTIQESRGQQSVANESLPAAHCAGDGSAAVAARTDCM